MKRIFNNLHFKTLSLALSIILWIYVTAEVERGLWWGIKKVTFREVPVRIMGLKEERFNIEIKPEKVSIVLSGYKGDVENVTRDDIVLFVNLTNLAPATYEMEVENIVPQNLNVNKIEPAKVTVTIRDEYLKPLTLGIFEEQI